MLAAHKKKKQLKKRFMCVFVGLVDTGVGFGRCVYGERRKTASVEEKNKMVAIR